MSEKKYEAEIASLKSERQSIFSKIDDTPYPEKIKLLNRSRTINARLFCLTKDGIYR